MIERLSLAAGAWDDVLAHAKEAAPAECCGLLLGRPGQVTASARARNIAPDPARRFEVDPADHFAAIRRARAAGLMVLGAYHSHPNGPAHPSDTDRMEAFEDGNFVHLIADPANSTVAAYLLIGGNFLPLPLVRSA